MSEQSFHGIIPHDDSARPTDYLYRVSIKCVIRNEKGEVLLVKETDRSWWDLPGGGMDHGEGVGSAIARELKEEVNLSGDFTYRIIACEDPAHLREHDFWQIRLIFEVKPDRMVFSPGADADEVAFMDPADFKDSVNKTDRRIYEYTRLI